MKNLQKKITSPSNQLVKDLVRIRERKGPESKTSFMVEGLREISRAKLSGYQLLDLVVCDDVADQITEELPLSEAILVSRSVFAKLAMRESSDGVLARFATKESELPSRVTLQKAKNPMIIAVENVEKPGNFGAILRSADAAGISTVVVLNSTFDLYNPNVIRSSLGGLFSINVIKTDQESFKTWAAINEVPIIAAALGLESVAYSKLNLRQNICCLLLGSEDSGISEYWRSNANQFSHIPMHGVCDSLNVSVAAAIYMYESLRQNET